VKVLFLGRGRLGYLTLGRLLEAGYEIPIIVTCDHSPEVGSSPEEFRALAEAHRIEYYHTNDINTAEWVSRLSACRAEIGVALLWLYTIQEPIVKTTKFGLLNYHGGDLPRYRGNACANWAILKGEKQIGMAVHLMDPGRLDSGPIIVKDYLSIDENSYIGEITDEVTRRGPELILRAIRAFEDGSAQPLRQNENEALYCYPRLPRDGEIDWQRSADEIFALIRAAGRPYPGAYTYYRAKSQMPLRKMTIWKAHIEAHHIDFLARPGHLLKLMDGQKWGVATGDKRLIVLDEIEIDGQPVEACRHFKSVRIRLGLACGDEVYRLNAEVAELKRQMEELRQNRQ